MAGKWAHDRGADEALILNPDKSISETNTANILLIQNKTVRCPQSRHVLPGVMEKVVCEYLVDRGYRMEQEKIFVRDMFSAERVILTNALMGVVPVIAIGRRQLKKPDGWCDRINRRLFNAAGEQYLNLA